MRCVPLAPMVVPARTAVKGLFSASLLAVLAMPACAPAAPQAPALPSTASAAARDAGPPPCKEAPAPDPAASWQSLVERAQAAPEGCVREALFRQARDRLSVLTGKPGTAVDFERGYVRPENVTLDDRFLVGRAKVSPPGADALVVRTLEEPGRGRVVRVLLPAETNVDVVGHVGPHRVVVTDREKPRAWVVDADTGREVGFESAARSPAIQGALIATLTAEGRPVVFDAATEKVAFSWDRRFDLANASVRFEGAPAMVVVTAEQHTFVASSATGAVLYERDSTTDPDIEIAAVSRTGRYLAIKRSSSGVGAFVVLHDTADKKELFRSAGGGYFAPVAAIDAGETVFISTRPSGVIDVVSLPRGTRRTMVSTLRSAEEGYSYYLDEVGITDDGRFACAHEATSIDKYTSCDVRDIFDLKKGTLLPKDRTGASFCFLAGGHAQVVRIPNSVLGAGAKGMNVSRSATYTRVCNPALSFDGKWAAIQRVEMSKQEPTTYSDREVVVVDTASSSVTATLGLGPGPSGMGEEFSAAVLTNPPLLFVLAGEEGGIFRLPSGKRLTDGWSELSPGRRFLVGETFFDLTTDTQFQLAEGGEQTPYCSFGALVAPIEVCGEPPR